MTGADLFWLAPAAPLAAFVALAAGLNRYGPLARKLAVAAVAASTSISGYALLAAARGDPARVSMPWLSVGGRELTFALALDPLGALVAFVVSTVSLLVFVYAASYMARDPREGRFFTIFSLFAASMLVLVLAADLLTLFIAWEIVGVCSYLLIGFWYERPDVPAAATKAFLTTRTADLALLAGILLVVGAAGTSRIDVVMTAVSEGRIDSGRLLASALLIFAGAAGKSAQVPFHGWLPDAMVGPTPVSALLHSATMVAAGVFLIARVYPLFLAAPPSLPVIAWVGVTTALLGGAAALVQTDLKRTLAYSTMSQLGLMFVGLGSGSLLAGVLLLLAQALYKAPLFLAAGAVQHAVGSTAFERMGGLARRMPFTFLIFALAAAALAGLPVTLALPPKDAVLAAGWEAGAPLFLAALLASLLTALYSARILGLVFFGVPSEAARRAHEAPNALVAPMLAFAGLIIVGLLADASIVDRPLERLLGGEAPDMLAATMMALLVAAAGFGLGLLARRIWPGQVIWPPLGLVAPLLAGELGLRWLYGALAQIGLRVCTLLGAFDRRVFDRATGEAARMILWMVRRTSAFDRTVFDAAAASGAAGTLALVRASGRFDVRRLDDAFNAFGRGLLGASQRMRVLQTGRIENYLLPIFVWGLLVLVVFAF